MQVRLLVRESVQARSTNILPIDLVVYTRGEYQYSFRGKVLLYLREIESTGKTLYEKAN